MIAAVSVSGPIERLSRNPGRLHARAVVAASEAITLAACCSDPVSSELTDQLLGS